MPFGFDINGNFYSINNISGLPQNVVLDGSYIPDGGVGNIYGQSQLPVQVQVVNGNTASLDQLILSDYGANYGGFGLFRRWDK